MANVRAGRETTAAAAATTSAAQVAPGGAGVAQLQSMLAQGQADPQQIGGLISAFPGERDPILATLQSTLGNSFVQRVVAVLGARGGDAGAMGELGAAFGADFSDVSVHRDGKADALGAHAYAQGEAIHLAANRGDPETKEGKALLGHELAHVVQQREGRVTGAQGKGGAIHADPALEAEADRAGAAVANGQPVADASRAQGGSARGASMQAKAADAPIQMFDSVGEHKAAGDDGSNHLEYVWSKHGKSTEPDVAADHLPKHRHRLGSDEACDPNAVAHAFEFRLTHGDIVMLSGDLFDPRDVDEHGAPVADSLFKLAGTPSTDPGRTLFSQDEIIYAIYRENPNDPRFDPDCTKEQPGAGAWAHYPRLFSSQIEKAVDDRFLQLAARNRDHFARPDDKEQGLGGVRSSGQGAYRGLHEDALRRAYKAGLAGQDPAAGLVREAAAEHFLTDAFSAGHIRTPRASILDFWNARYPHFFESFQHVLEEGVTNQMTSDGAGGITAHIAPGLTGPVIGHVVHTRVQTMLNGVPRMSFGDVVSKVAHDSDNEHGLWVINDAKQRWKAFGDGHMYEADPDNKTPEMTRLSVQLGVDDVQTAYTLGVIDAGKATRADEALFADVKGHAKSPATPGPKYAAEQIIPMPDPDRIADNGVRDWTASSFEDLWNTPIRTDRPETFGDLITAALQPGGAFYDMLASKASSLAENQSGVHPREGFLAFIKQMSNDPHFWMSYILRGAS